jgi:hypothetical protein
MINTTQLVKAFINSHHGWAVADQFEATFDGEEFEKQNFNALTYIEQAVSDIFNSGILNVEANDELEDYLVELHNYLKK